MIWILVIPVILYFVVFILAASFLKRLNSGSILITDRNIKVSVIIPARNEERNLPFILTDLAAQDYPAELYEVIVVDDHSEDGTYETAVGFKDISNYKVLRNSGRGKKAAIKTGVEASSTEFIITTDADCRMGSEWIGAFAFSFDVERPAMLIVPVLLAKRRSLLNVFQQIEWLGLQGITAGTALAGQPVMCNGANLGFTKKTYLRHYGEIRNDIPSGDDIFLLHAVKASGTGRIVWLYDNRAMVTTDPPASVTGLLKQRVRWLSKAGAYRDLLIISLAVITLSAVLSLGFLMIATLVDTDYLLVFLTGFVLKNVADIFITVRMAHLLKQKPYWQWVAPLQFMYPFYVLGVIFFLLHSPQGRKKG